MHVSFLLSVLILQDRDVLLEMERKVQAILEKVRPSVVSITSRHEVKDKTARKGSLRLSGVIVSTDGLVVTEASGVEGADDVSVSLWDDRIVSGRDLVVDQPSGLAVLRIEADGLRPAELASEEGVRSGCFAFSIGNAFGLRGNVQMGLVSGLRRSIFVGGHVLDDMIQMTTPVNPGDAGAFVANSEGKLIGIVNSRYSVERSWVENLFGQDQAGFRGAMPESVSFATPAGAVEFLLRRMSPVRKVSRGRLGIGVRMVEGGMRGQLGLPVGVGAEVVSVEKNGPAARAGLVKHDILLKFDGEPVTDATGLRRKVTEFMEPRKVVLEVMRQRNIRSIEVIVEISNQ